MVDSSVILAIVKDEDRKKICEEKLNEAKRAGRCFMTHVGLGEIYKGAFEFISQELNGGYEDFDRKDMANRYKIEFMQRTLNALNMIMEDIKVLEFDKDCSEKINELFRCDGLRMGSRDRLILGIAEAHANTNFISLDNGIKEDYMNLENLGFHIEINSLS
jgi:hypothetical protein